MQFLLKIGTFVFLCLISSGSVFPQLNDSSVFEDNIHFSFNLKPFITSPVRYESFTEYLSSTSAFGFQSGFEVIYNYDDNLGLGSGLNFGGHSIKSFLTTDKFDIPLDIDFNFYFMSIPVFAEYRFRIGKNYFLGGQGGFNIMIFPRMEYHLLTGVFTNGNSIELYEQTYFFPDKLNPHYGLLGGISIYRILPNQNLLKLSLSGNYALTSPIKSEYWFLDDNDIKQHGFSSFNFHHLGLQLSYVISQKN